MRISDWSSDVCSSDLRVERRCAGNPRLRPALCAPRRGAIRRYPGTHRPALSLSIGRRSPITFNAGVVRFRSEVYNIHYAFDLASISGGANPGRLELNAAATHNSLLTTSVTGSSFNRTDNTVRSEEHTSELQSLMRISYAVFC